MKYDTVVQITNSYAIDFEAPGAACARRTVMPRFASLARVFFEKSRM